VLVDRCRRSALPPSIPCRETGPVVVPESHLTPGNSLVLYRKRKMRRMRAGSRPQSNGYGNSVFFHQQSIDLHDLAKTRKVKIAVEWNLGTFIAVQGGLPTGSQSCLELILFGK